MSTQSALRLNVTREAAVVADARKRQPDPDRVAFLRGQLSALAGEAATRDAHGWADPSIFVTVDGGGAGAPMGIIVHPDGTAEIGVTSPDQIRGTYRMSLDDAALVAATVGANLELGEGSS